jgi:hypothetical protein
LGIYLEYIVGEEQTEVREMSRIQPQERADCIENTGGTGKTTINPKIQVASKKTRKILGVVFGAPWHRLPPRETRRLALLSLNHKKKSVVGGRYDARQCFGVFSVPTLYIQGGPIIKGPTPTKSNN